MEESHMEHVDWSSFSIGNGAGYVLVPGKAFDALLRSRATEITIGPFTREPVPLDDKAKLYACAQGTSVHVPRYFNSGLKAALRSAKAMHKQARAAGKKLRWSIMGSTYEEYGDLADALSRFGTIEIGLYSPLSYRLHSPEVLRTILNATAGVCEPLDVKLPLILKIAERQPYIDILLKYPKRIGNVVAFYAVPTETLPVDGLPQIHAPNNSICIGGNALYPYLSTYVGRLMDAFGRTGIGIKCAGGINSAERVVEMYDKGVRGVQLFTHLQDKGEDAISAIYNEAEAMLEIRQTAEAQS